MLMSARNPFFCNCSVKLPSGTASASVPPICDALTRLLPVGADDQSAPDEREDEASFLPNDAPAPVDLAQQIGSLGLLLSLTEARETVSDLFRTSGTKQLRKYRTVSSYLSEAYPKTPVDDIAVPRARAPGPDTIGPFAIP